MDFFKRDYHFIFNASKWSETREKGYLKFTIFPVIVVFLCSLWYSFIFLKDTTQYYKHIIRGFILLNSGSVFLFRSLAWLWKEYKYKRYIENETNFTKIDYLISIVNCIRIVGNFIAAAVILYIMYRLRFD
ncbi:hypothetical protein [Tissierella praeacuta]|uniref:hypothetical protein n=1 Tax=Tissierella praeacuta TaxID=43131 RepID=UPI00333FAB30